MVSRVVCFEDIFHLFNEKEFVFWSLLSKILYSYLIYLMNYYFINFFAFCVSSCDCVWKKETVYSQFHGPPLKTAGQNLDKGQNITQTQDLNTVEEFSSNKNPTTEPGIKSGISWSLRQSVLFLSLWIHGLRPRKLYTSVTVTPAPVRVPTEPLLIPSFRTVVS